MAQVRSKRCDIHTKFVTHTPCTSCAAIRKQLCPWGWSRNFPEKILLDCRYEFTCFFPLSRGWQGIQRNLADLQVGAKYQ